MATTFTRACYFYDVLLLRRIARASMGCCMEKAWGRCPAASPARGGRQVCESLEESAARELKIARNSSIALPWGRCPAASPAHGGRQVCESLEECACGKLMVASIVRHAHLKTLEV